MTLTEFLTARLDEDEAEALYVTGDYAHHATEWKCWSTGVLDTGAPWPDGSHALGDGPLVYHIIRWDPARVLAEVAAKRAILERVDDQEQPLSDGHWESTGYDEYWVADREPELLRLLAQPYASHPDFDPAWKVTP